MTIKVYSSIMPDAEVELYEACGVTIEQWVKGKAKDYKAGDKQPLSCFVNGVMVKPSEWANRVIYGSDLVEFRVVPYGALDFAFPFITLPFRGASAALKYLYE